MSNQEDINGTEERVEEEVGIQRKLDDAEEEKVVHFLHNREVTKKGPGRTGRCGRLKKLYMLLLIMFL